MGVIADALAAGPPEEEPKPTGKVDITFGEDGQQIGGTFTDVVTDAPVTDWSEIFTRFKLDPEVFVIKGDTVRMSIWQQSKRTESGDRDIVDLYAYRAEFTRRTEPAISAADIDAAIERVRAWKLPRRSPGTGLGEPVAAVLNLADLQWGKAEGGGVAATEQRLFDGLENFGRFTERMRKGGRNINELVIVNNGDPYEGIGGNYDGQTFQVEGGLRRQMNGVLDVWSAYARELFPRYDLGQFVSVLCNHTELGRMGTRKNQTDDSDSGSALLAEALQRILAGRPEFDHVRFTIPDDQMNVYTTIASVPVGFNHGHKIPGTADASSFEKWLNGQVRGDEKAHEARLWITAHKHHFAAWDMGSCTVIQCPSCDGGSKWLRDMTGRFSRSGILALLVGEHDPSGWSDITFL